MTKQQRTAIAAQLARELKDLPLAANQRVDLITGVIARVEANTWAEAAALAKHGPVRKEYLRNAQAAFAGLPIPG